jgi:ELWxxDGT repeat protein
MTNVRVLFNGDDANNDQQLWSTDGTDDGTSPIIVAGASASGLDPDFLTALPLVTVFKGVDASGDSDLWVTDGTGTGTFALTVSGAQPGGLDPAYLTRFGSDALFAGFDASGAQQLWITDGTGAGTVELTQGASLDSGVGVAPYEIVSLGSRAVFNGLSSGGLAELWSTDGTAANTFEISPATADTAGLDPQDLTRFGTLGLFFGADSHATTGLWKTDGTAAGTVEIAQGVGDSANLLTPFVTVGSKALFEGLSSTGLGELLSTDGDTVTTLLAAGEGAAGLQPADITGFGSKALLSGVDAAGANELWITDGTTAGTTELTAGAGGAAGLSPLDIVDLGPVALFQGLTATGPELFVTDGTAAGTHEVTVPGASPLGLAPTDITAFGALGLFEGIDSANAAQLFAYDVATGAVTEVSSAAAFPMGLGPTELTPATVQCFMPGARIRTPAGEAAVEDLRPGDLVEAGLGRGAARVRWIGRRRIDASRHRDPALVWPFRVRAGAFGPRLPARDLMLSPDHAVRLGGVLAPVRAFANGMTVVQEPRGVIEYLHVELDGHGILFAEGLEVESYLDDGTRAQFEGGAVLELHPDFSAGRSDGSGACLPLATDAATLRALWNRPARRAVKLGFARPETRLTSEPLLRLQAGALALAPAQTGPRRLSFELPRDAREVRLTSRAASPAATQPWLDDRRLLGVSVARLLVGDASGRTSEMALDAAALGAGWHAPERDAGGAWRWTDGDGAVSLPRDATRLEVQLAGDMTYPADAPPARARAA